MCVCARNKQNSKMTKTATISIEFAAKQTTDKAGQ